MDSLGSRLAKPWRLVGFGLLQTWVLLVALSPASFTDNAFFLQDSYAASLLLSGGLFASYLVFIVLDAFHSIYQSRKMLITACAVAGAGTVLMLWGDAPAPVVAGGIVLANAGSAFLSLWWGKHGQPFPPTAPRCTFRCPACSPAWPSWLSAPWAVPLPWRSSRCCRCFRAWCSSRRPTPSNGPSPTPTTSSSRRCGR